MVDRKTQGRILTEIWHRKLGTLIKKRGVSASGAFQGHLVIEKENSYDLNTDWLVIIESVICHAHLLDMVVSKPIKGRLCNMYGEWLPSELPFSLKKYKATIWRAAGAVDWNCLGWNFTEKLQQGSKKCCMSDDMKETEDDVPCETMIILWYYIITEHWACIH